MRYCGICGRERNGNARFCGTCGGEFRDEDAIADEPAAQPAQPAEPAEPAQPAAEAAEEPASPYDAEPQADAGGWTSPGDAGGWSPPADATRWDAPAPATRWEPPVDATRAEPTSAAGPDPFASWFKDDAGAGAAGAAAAGAGTSEPWEQPTQTVRRSPGQPFPGGPPGAPGAPRPGGPTPPQAGGNAPAGYPQAGYPPSSQGPSGYPQAGYPQAGYPPAARPANRSRRGLIILFAVILVLIGGGAYALASTLGKHSGANPAPTASGVASTPAVSTPATTAGASAASSPSGSTSASASASPTASATPSPALSLVAVGPGVSSATLPQVETLFSRYFQGINKHDYQEYASALNPQQQANQPESTFNSGYATTTDSGMTLTSLTPNSNGGQTAIVAFTSRQNPADSVDKSACNTWTLTYYLVPQGTGYLIGPAPAGAPQPSYADC